MIDHLQPYPKYHDSGLPWLGKIPVHWEEKRAKYFYREVDERSTTGEEELLSVSHKTGVTPRPRHVTMFKAESNVGHKICRPDDLVINTMWAFMAALGIAKQIGVVSPSYGVYRPSLRRELLPAYADRLLRIEGYKAEYLCRSTGIRASRLRLYPEEFLRIPILSPPRDEQAAIVRFLDHFDRRIRRYIRAKRRLISLLNEQKQAIIHRAVTRGLHPNVQLKPSGVEWLGEVPEHWEVLRLARVIADGPRNGISPPINENGTIESFSISAIRDGKVDIKDGDKKYVSGNKVTLEVVYRLRCGDVLLVRGNGNIRLVGKAGLVEHDMPERVYPDLLMRVRLTSKCIPHFLVLLLNCPIGRDQIEMVARTAVGTFKVNNQQVRQLCFALPPVVEQQAIVDWIDQELRTVKAMSSRAKVEMALFHEYRTRLIADVVTGKLDVREAAARLPDDGDADGEIAEDLLEGDEPVDDTEQDTEAEEIEG